VRLYVMLLLYAHNKLTTSAGAGGDINQSIVTNVYEVCIPHVQMDETLIMRQASVLDALKPVKDVQYDKHPPSLRRSCTEGTREQILADLMEWARGYNTPNIYWLCGMAGTGKTTIARSFCQKLKDAHLLGASFFCSRTLEETREIRAVIPTIAHELASRSAVIPSLLIEAVKQDQGIASAQPNVQFTSLIRDPINHSLARPQTVAFDAFDEFKTIDDARHLLTVLTRFAPSVPNIKLFITSRLMPQLDEVFRRVKGTSFYLHNVEESLVRNDIEQYLLERWAVIREGKRLSESWPAEEEHQAVLDNAGKLFIYASTICRFLENGKTAQDCQERLQIVLSAHMQCGAKCVAAYHPLDHLYKQALSAIDDYSRDHVLLVLHTVVTARNPLSIEAIAHLLGTSPSSVYTALTELRAVIMAPDDESSTEPVFPFHASFPDFLHTHSRSDIYHISETQAHHAMLKLCLGVFDSSLKWNICELHSNKVCLQDINPSPSSKIPEALQYSCTSWLVHLDHVLESGELGRSDESQVLNIFDKHILHWVECMALLGKLEDAVHLLQRIEVSPKVRHLWVDVQNI
jgi:hypothetical protein